MGHSHPFNHLRLAPRRWLSVDFAAVSQAYDLHNQAGILNVDNDAVISDAVLPVIAQRGADESLAEAAGIVEEGDPLA